MIMAIITNSGINFRVSFISCAYFLFSTIYCFVHIKYNYPFIDYILLLFCYLLLFLSVYKNYSFFRISKIIYIITLYLAFSSILQSIFSFIISFFHRNYLDQIVKNAINLVIYFLFAVIITKIFFKSNGMQFQPNTIPNYVYILILLALLISGGLIEFQLALSNTQVQGFANKLFTIISIFLLIFIITALVFNCISKAYLENVSSILERQVNAQVDYYKKVERLNTEIRNFRHDYKNHMICVQGLLDGQEYDEARKYIHGITFRKTILSKEFASGNVIANAILSDKYEQAEKIGVEIQFQGIVFENIPAADLCTILANALDNAIEACEKIMGDEPKIISVKCSYVKHIQFIWISNPVAEDVKITNNAVETYKADKNIHGIGLYNIRRTVAKYEGEFEISCKDKLFVMDIGFKVN